MKYISSFFLTLANIYLYDSYLSVNFEYMGYSNKVFNIYNVLAVLLLSVIPLFWRLKKEECYKIFFTFYYIILYIPIIVAFGFLYESSVFLYRSFFIIVGFYISISIMNSSWKVPIIKRARIYGTSLNLIWLIQLLMLLVLFYFFRSEIDFVQFDKVYEKRGEMKYNFRILGYFVLWTTYFTAPLLIIYGLKRKLKGYIFLGCFASIFIYGITAAKIVFFIPLLILLVNYLYNRKIDIFDSINLIFGFAIFAGVYFSNFLGLLGPVLLQRTFGNSGLLTYQYAEFFEKHSFTYYSHVSVIGNVIGYPFNKELGFMVFDYFNNSDLSTESNSNASFIATDGYAAFGNLGVLIINFITGLYMKLSINQFSSSQKEIAGFMFVPFMFMLSNVSFFTCVISGGWIFLNFSSFIRKESI